MKMTIALAFIALIFLVAVVYYTGLVSDVNAVGGQLTGFANVLSGRPQGGGAFGNYPTTQAA